MARFLTQFKRKYTVLNHIGFDSPHLTESALLSYLQALPESVHIVLTGRYFPQRILDKADCISEIRCVRHPYENGISAVEGIEY